ncbi:uncharacterized protein LACBIDRAFT_293244 [Laccaria bicolor S238N-H82]|uniref:Predicted protein n=1 Tax=Laccaria bicolor (strain S238N-H82 / ATCC MYA-4686) TaxID=486041 RepID=B0D1Z2_LACBS|nr:uncharacterized protein LACBIDRAFT_293244 [Laccaria bicolor S238N-H82]EDR11726.1 predicted protein [Laccaria bicolor S238N-H82]|eukprot:XP_001877623.1 predicted protein [Laccaria bicolor S238N-H82]
MLPSAMTPTAENVSAMTAVFVSPRSTQARQSTIAANAVLRYDFRSNPTWGSAREEGGHVEVMEEAVVDVQAFGRRAVVAQSAGMASAYLSTRARDLAFKVKRQARARSWINHHFASPARPRGPSFFFQTEHSLEGAEEAVTQAGVSWPVLHPRLLVRYWPSNGVRYTQISAQRVSLPPANTQGFNSVMMARWYG